MRRVEQDCHIKQEKGAGNRCENPPAPADRVRKIQEGISEDEIFQKNHGQIGRKEQKNTGKGTAAKPGVQQGHADNQVKGYQKL